MVVIDAVDGFDEACEELHVLLSYSRRNQSNVRRYRAFNKAAIVLLCAKFEAFLEAFLEEYAYLHLHNSSNLTLDAPLLQHLVDCLLSSIEECNRGRIARRNNLVKDLARLYGTTEIRPLNTYTINNKLKMGKHGQGEVQRLLNSFGFGLYVDEDDTKDFFTAFNSLNNIRNNIIHEDATPNLTHGDVENYLDIVSRFITGLHQHADNKLQPILPATI